MRTGKLAAQGDLTFQGGWRDVYSATEPTVKTKTRWWETDGSGLPLYGWPWWWDGTYWRSPRQILGFNTVCTSDDSVWLPVNQSFDYYLRAIRVGAASGGTVTNYWQVKLSRRNASNADTQIAVVSLQQATVTAATAINSHLSVAGTGAQLLWWLIAKVGAPGVFFGGGELEFDYVRL